MSNAAAKPSRIPPNTRTVGALEADGGDDDGLVVDMVMNVMQESRVLNESGE